MRISKRDSTDERRIVIGMIVDEQLLSHISSRYSVDMFNSKWSNLIAGWCVKYYRKYNKAPKKTIESLFDSWAEAESTRDKETVKIVERFLSSLSGEYVQLALESNSQYLVDRASSHFNRVRATRLASLIDGDVAKGDIDKAVARIQGFEKVEMGRGTAVDVLHSPDNLRMAFENKSEVLIKYSGALENFFGNALERDGFIALMAPEKRGKTFWLIDMAWRAMIQRRRVAFFAVGDMSESQMLRRLAVRACQRPLEAKKFNVPTSIIRDPSADIAELSVKEKEYTGSLDWKEAWKAFEAVRQHRIKSDDSYFRMSVHPNSSINVQGIRSIIGEWDRDGWVPDVIVIDYADILGPPSGSNGDDTRTQTNTSWKQLRAMSQALHCLVITATQTDSASYLSDLITKKNFSEDKRKYAHVTGMFGINQTEPEKELGLYRLNWIVLRESKFSESKCVHVAGCLDICNPAMKSVF